MTLAILAHAILLVVAALVAWGLFGTKDRREFLMATVEIPMGPIVGVVLLAIVAAIGWAGWTVGKWWGGRGEGATRERDNA